MRLLLDTHVFLWMNGEPERLTRRVRNLLVDARHELVLSAVVPWEIGLKIARGKLKLPEPLERNCATRASAAGMQLLDVRFAHVFEASRLPRHHDDPFDRMLVAQARIEQLTVVTADEALRAYDVELVAT